jgi:3-dehydroquinate synthase
VVAIHVPIHERRDASYDVLVGRGLLAELPRLVAERCPAHRYAVIADHRVAELHGRALLEAFSSAGLDTRLFPFPSGEWNKTRETWAELCDAMLKARIGRDGAVIAFGGGVAGDLGGFVAATYLRGVPYVQVPTTLLAMIDSSVGGKTGIDIPAGKNLIGAFHQPRLVVADVDLLATLPRPQLAAGMAEAIKHGVIADAAYFASLEDCAPVLAKEPSRLEPLVRRSVELKAEVVAADERELGRRQVLNFGHTVGHAIESMTGFDLLHGEAVAIGMAVEAALSETLGLAGRGLRQAILAMLERYGLPTTLPDGLATAEVLKVMAQDKKARAGRIRFALPTRVGAMAQSADGGWTVEAGTDAILRVLSAARS